MTTEQIREEAFIAGYTQGYKVGWNRVEIAPSEIKPNAETAYQLWLKESGQHLIDSGTFPQK